MAVFRVERNKGYTVMSNHHLRNKELTLKAKGLLSQMLSLPEDWDYTLAGLSQINRESIDAIRTAVWELEKAGYIKRRQGRDEKGKMTAIEYTIYEQPQPPDDTPPGLDNPTLENPTPGNPILENPTPGKPTTENPMQLNKDIQRTDLPTKEKINTDLNPRILSAVRNFYRMLLNPRKRLETQGFKQVNNSIPVIRSRPLLRASRELAREKSREDIGFWSVKDKASVGCRDVTSQQTCTLYQPKTSYKTGKRTSEDARFFHSQEVRNFEQPQHIPSQAAGQTAQGEGGPRPHTPVPGRDGCLHPPDGAAPIS